MKDGVSGSASASEWESEGKRGGPMDRHDGLVSNCSTMRVASTVAQKPV